MCGILPTSQSPPSRSRVSSDQPPGDLENWHVLLPSRPRAEQVARLVLHENASWDDASDLALLQLRVPVNLSAAPRPVCLPHPEHYFLPGSRCRLARWGRGGEQGPNAGGAGRSRAGRRLSSGSLLFPPRSRTRPQLAA